MKNTHLINFLIMKKAFLFLLIAQVSLADTFTTPKNLERDVHFWSRVYSQWDSNQVVYYDSETKTVYSVLNLPVVENQLSSKKFGDRVEKQLKEISDALDAVQSGMADAVTKDKTVRKIAEIVHGNSLLKAQQLSKRLRFQNGLRSQFEYGLRMSGRYADEMKAILRHYKLPEDLLAIVFVESLFYVSAQSHAGASGLWGIAEETAKRFGIHINNFTDERFDPHLSTVAAAEYIMRAMQELKEWPLVITSYNYGYSGMMRAVKNLNTSDLDVIIQQHDSPLFGYASKNYYAEFLAALDCWKQKQRYFSDIKPHTPWEYDMVQVLRPADVSDLYRYKVLEKTELSELNPALTKRTLAGEEVLPVEYALRVPKGKKDQFYQRLKKIPRVERSRAGFKISSKYKSSGEESLYIIAKKHGISAQSLSDRMDKPLNYQPKGVIIIRSPDHLFSPLTALTQLIASARSGKIAAHATIKPAQN